MGLTRRAWLRLSAAALAAAAPAHDARGETRLAYIRPVIASRAAKAR